MAIMAIMAMVMVKGQLRLLQLLKQSLDMDMAMAMERDQPMLLLSLKQSLVMDMDMAMDMATEDMAITVMEAMDIMVTVRGLLQLSLAMDTAIPIFTMDMGAMTMVMMIMVMDTVTDTDTMDRRERDQRLSFLL